MNTMNFLFVPCALAAALASATIGCGGPQTGGGGSGGTAATATDGAKQASAVMEPKSGTTTSGTATFTTDGKAVTLMLEVANATRGEHAVHIHEKPDCSAPDAASAGEHWNPTNVAHGKPNGGPFHLGDIGNMKVGDDGRGSITHTTELWTIGTGDMNDVVGHSVIVHASADDFTSQPAGAAGGRISCGVIKRQ